MKRRFPLVLLVLAVTACGPTAPSTSIPSNSASAVQSQNAATDGVATLRQGLTTLATTPLGTLDAAIDKNDIAAARNAWQTFDSSWEQIEDGVKDRSPESYRTIETAMEGVEDALVRTEQPLGSDVKARTAELRKQIEQFANTLQ